MDGYDFSPVGVKCAEINENEPVLFLTLTVGKVKYSTG